jgi:hypothetical protein
MGVVLCIGVMKSDDNSSPAVLFSAFCVLLLSIAYGLSTFLPEYQGQSRQYSGNILSTQDIDNECDEEEVEDGTEDDCGEDSE